MVVYGMNPWVGQSLDSPSRTFFKGHLLLHMQLETRALGYWLVHIAVPPIGFTDPFSSLGTFSSSSIGDPVFHPINDYEHPLLYFPGTGIASQETAISGSFQ